MLTSEKLTSIDSPHFPALDALYVKAFPWHEQREPLAKQRALRDPHYALEAWFDDGEFIGLSGSWQFAGYGYIEHLAIDDGLRSRGYGKRLLAEILKRAPLTILEIDPLTTEIARRRLQFYAAMGFSDNPWPHRHPTYHYGIADHALMVLSYPQAIDEAQYRHFAQQLRQVVMA
ncbi:MULTISPECIES: GNAT family N-acetyltransferase [Raoultella]|uniref:GNAT family N-acetyltransferase n=1 Tax=Raoultella TaxID=160674 RepID=UPI00216999DA|nr:MULTISPECIES: GNAT family N-acetyltransferase [Raoultella]MCS4272398.1 GNAT superfamily N-acetyltransferase [Raoultella sp. BIGb0132]MCS4289265.1 GNAT superfamily N-acetyltransferase [Raoultella terrigena]